MLALRNFFRQYMPFDLNGVDLGQLIQECKTNEDKQLPEGLLLSLVKANKVGQVFVLVDKLNLTLQPKVQKRFDDKDAENNNIFQVMILDIANPYAVKDVAHVLGEGGCVSYATNGAMPSDKWLKSKNKQGENFYDIARRLGINLRKELPPESVDMFNMAELNKPAPATRVTRASPT